MAAPDAARAVCRDTANDSLIQDGGSWPCAERLQPALRAERMQRAAQLRPSPGTLLRTSLQDLWKAATPTRASTPTFLRNQSKKLLFASEPNSVPFYRLKQHWTEESLLGTHLGRFGNIFWRSFKSKSNFNFFLNLSIRQDCFITLKRKYGTNDTTFFLLLLGFLGTEGSYEQNYKSRIISLPQHALTLETWER